MNFDPSTLTVHPYAPHHRPELHFAPEKNWINDPNGLIFLNGQYHLFFQHNPFGTDWGHMSWGHAVSRDLLHWEELPVALPEDDEAMIFSGCCVLDFQNTSGLGTLEHPPLIALYTAHHDQTGLQTQNLAYSLDEGQNWAKYGVVLDEGIRDFRDPKVFWHENTQRWIMAVVLAEHRQVVLYASLDLKSWEKQSTFGPAGHTGGIWEVPELLELQDDAGQSHWVVKVDLNPGGPQGGSGCQYFVGQFDGQTFTPTQKARWLDYGKDFYAAITFANLEGRTVWLAWMNNWQYARTHTTGQYSGNMSLPRELYLLNTSEGLVLAQTPIRELDSLWEPIEVPSETQLRAVQHKDLLALKKAVLDLHVQMNSTDQSVYGLVLHCAGQLEWALEFDHLNHTLTLTRQGTVDEEGFQGQHTAPMVSMGVQDVRLILDHSSLEVFVDGGKLVFTEMFFPQEGESRLSMYARSGNVNVHVLHARTPPLV